jgi:hypothetical protein
VYLASRASTLALAHSALVPAQFASLAGGGDVQAITPTQKREAKSRPITMSELICFSIPQSPAPKIARQ